MKFEDRLEVDKALGELRAVEDAVLASNHPVMAGIRSELIDVLKKAHAEILEEVADVGDE